MRGGAPERLFVYGSLQPGGTNAHVLDGIEGAWEPGVVKGRLIEAGWGAGMGYPAVVLDENGDDVRGHVLTSADLSEHWAALDDFEGEEYERTIATITLGSGERVRAHLYVMRKG